MPGSAHAFGPHVTGCCSNQPSHCAHSDCHLTLVAAQRDHRPHSPLRPTGCCTDPSAHETAHARSFLQAQMAQSFTGMMAGHAAAGMHTAAAAGPAAAAAPAASPRFYDRSSPSFLRAQSRWQTALVRLINQASYAEKLSFISQHFLLARLAPRKRVALVQHLRKKTFPRGSSQWLRVPGRGNAPVRAHAQ